ncbi:family 43 glycosylhydrolase [Marinimicrobium alkaliphilum]|uniref:family 43 glycosylhydrolase n=1 Tax=Marinimicrobium alkaliphilum TaxID=2202654 RepID=UPI000DB92BCA|nr:family 43 glycosylhydrolase [Marinimicrobium alkaliphilum]
MKSQYWLALAWVSVLIGCGSSADGPATGNDQDPSDASTSSASSAPPASASNLPFEVTAEPVEGGFFNPLYSNGADPWLEYFDGNYYLTTTTWGSQIVMRRSPTLAGLADARPIYIWSDTTPDRGFNFWAFEFHRLQGPDGYRWYLIYSAGVQNDLDGQKLRVLESVGDDPMGPYVYKGTPMPDTWNIDGSYLTYNDDLYLLWSEWIGPNQTVRIARMENPWTITGPRVTISTPTYTWERQGDAPVNEGPVIIERDGRTFMAFSASHCHGPEYKLGVMELVGDNPVDASAWHKFDEPFFEQANGVYGPAHNGFFTSPDGTEDWIVYHGHPNPAGGCDAGRAVRAQPIGWTDEGLPFLGEPTGTDMAVPPPSGEFGPTTGRIQGPVFQIVNHGLDQCLSLDGEGQVALGDCASTQSEWVLDATNDGYYRLGHAATGTFLGGPDCSETSVALGPWVNQTCQRWQLSHQRLAWYHLIDQHTGEPLVLGGCDASSDGACREWRVQPAQSVALLSANSAKAVQAQECSTSAGANIEQWQWTGEACQRWTFSHTDNGYLHLSAGHADVCLAVAGASGELGANSLQAACTGEHSQWWLDPLADGSFRLLPRHAPDRVLDLENCRLENGTNIGQWEWLDNDCQRFVLRDPGD